MVTGSGTSNDPYMLYNLSDLEQIVTLGLNKYYKLANDIDASATADPGYNSGAGWKPIGTSSTPVLCNFDGDNKSIIGLYVNRPNTDYVGLFGFGRATIKNIKLLKDSNGNGAIIGKNSTGGILGYATYGGDTVIQYCTVEIPITGNEGVGGIVGSTANATNIMNCSYNTVNTIITGVNYIGGIIGNNVLKWTNKSHIDYNNVRGTINATGIYVGGVAGAGCGISLIYNNLNNLVMNLSATSDYVGGLIGAVYASNGYDIYALNNTVIVDISGRDYVGGILGGTPSVIGSVIQVINNSYTGNVSGRNYVGGLVGKSDYTHASCLILNNTINSTVTGSGNNIGGVAGQWVRQMIDQTVDNVVINVSATSDSVGGLIGLVKQAANCDTYLTNCIFIGDLSGRNNVGGLIGNGANQNGDIARCYTEGDITASGQYIGGLIGFSRLTTHDCYSIMSVTGGTHVGGAVGRMDANTLSKCYSTGLVSGTSSLGGLVGSKNSGVESSCYWDTQTSGQIVSALGTGKTTTEMKTQNTYTNWDFSTPVWDMDADGRNNGYPYLDGNKPDLPKQSGSGVWFKLRNRHLKIG